MCHKICTSIDLHAYIRKIYQLDKKKMEIDDINVTSQIGLLLNGFWPNPFIRDNYGKRRSIREDALRSLELRSQTVTRDLDRDRIDSPKRGGYEFTHF